jgi:hypothetical protein
LTRDVRDFGYLDMDKDVTIAPSDAIFKVEGQVAPKFRRDYHSFN